MRGKGKNNPASNSAQLRYLYLNEKRQHPMGDIGFALLIGDMEFENRVLPAAPKIPKRKRKIGNELW